MPALGACTRRLTMAGALGLGACAAPEGTPPDRFELANMWPGNVVPKSSPAQFVSAFRRFCVEPEDSAGAAPLLAAADYVENPRARSATARAFVVDDRRPAVVLSDRPSLSTCSVMAQSRTGQTNRARSFVRAAFPAARAVDPGVFGGDFEQAWIVADDPRTFVLTSRIGTPNAPALYVLTRATATSPTVGAAR